MKGIRIIILTIILGIIAVGAIFYSSVFTVGKEVKELCESAREKYYGRSCVETLSTVLNDEKNDFMERNSAIWALGQIGDPKALPVLDKHFTRKVPKTREPLDKMLSQYEIKKAIENIKNGPNFIHYFWRKDLGY